MISIGSLTISDSGLIGKNILLEMSIHASFVFHFIFDGGFPYVLFFFAFQGLDCQMADSSNGCEDLCFLKSRIDALFSFREIAMIQIDFNFETLIYINEMAAKLFRDIRHMNVVAGMKTTEFMIPSAYSHYKSLAEQIKIDNKRILYERELPWISHDRATMIIREQYSPVFDSNKRLIGFIHTYEDITNERYLMSEKVQLLEAQQVARNIAKQKSDFIIHMSHELRTPLTGLLGMMESLFSSLSLTDEESEMAKLAMNSGEHLRLLVNDILDLSKLEAGKVDVYLTKFKLTEILENSCSMFVSLAEKKGINIISVIDPCLLGEFYGDKLHLQQIAVNFLSNAVKFSKNKFVAITLERCCYVPQAETSYNCFILLSVIDQGIGIPADSMAKIFKPFSQANSKIHREFGGTGMGLSIVDKLAQLLKGYVSFHSVEKQGSTFRLHVPIMMLKEAPTQKLIAKVDFDVSDDLLFQSLRLWSEKSFDQCQDCLSELILTEQPKPGKCILLCHKPNCKDLCDGLHGPYYSWEIASIAKETIESLQEVTIPRPAKRKLIALDCKNTVSIACKKQDKAKEKHHFNVKNVQKVLIVDDNLINIKVLAKVIEKMNVFVVTAVNGRIAFELTRSNKFDLIFMDCIMPVMDGYEATLKIRQREFDEKLHRTPIVAITANALAEDMNRCMTIGMDEYLSKPFQTEQVLKACEKYLKR